MPWNPSPEEWAVIQAGLDDVEAGRVVPHELVVREMRERLAIREGVEEMKAGRVTPHDEVMRDMERRHPELRKP
jgi:predicted transcriptional regulator